MSAEYEPAGRKVGRYLNNIPGLTNERLAEFWRAVQGICGREAMANLTYPAVGGLRIEIHWPQNGMKQNYVAALSAEDVAGAMDIDEDALFRNFAAMTLDSVRLLVNQLAGHEQAAGDDAPTFQGTKDAVDTLLGSLRANAHSVPATRPLQERFAWDGEWESDAIFEPMPATAITMHAEDVTIDGHLRRIWCHGETAERVYGLKGWADPLPNPPDTAPSGESDEVPRDPQPEG